MLYGADDRVRAFLLERLPHVRDFGPSIGLGLVDNSGTLVGGVVYNNWNPGAGDIELTAAVDTKAWFRPRSLALVFRYAFETAQCGRITMRIAKRNKPARRFAEGTGFKLEGTLRRAAPGGQDLIVYGLLASECRLLPKG